MCERKMVFLILGFQQQGDTWSSCGAGCSSCRLRQNARKASRSAATGIDQLVACSLNGKEGDTDGRQLPAYVCHQGEEVAQAGQPADVAGGGTRGDIEGTAVSLRRSVHGRTKGGWGMNFMVSCFPR